MKVYNMIEIQPHQWPVYMPAVNQPRYNDQHWTTESIFAAVILVMLACAMVGVITL